jgi:hypothetical protein
MMNKSGTKLRFDLAQNEETVWGDCCYACFEAGSGIGVYREELSIFIGRKAASVPSYKCVAALAALSVCGQFKTARPFRLGRAVAQAGIFRQVFCRDMDRIPSFRFGYATAK